MQQPLMDSSTPDDAVFAKLYQQHAQSILQFIRRYLSAREDAEDVLLEVFLAAMNHGEVQDYREDQQLAWLRRVAHNKCMDVYRRASRRPAVPLEESSVDLLYEDEDRAPENIALRSEEYAFLRTLLEKLPAQQQTVLRLRFEYDMRSPEIARQLKKSEASVRVLLSRALNQLRTLYNREALKERRS